MMPTTTTAPMTIQSHGTFDVVVLVVVEEFVSGLVAVLSVVVAEPPAGALLLEAPGADPLVVVVVPLVVDCARVIAGATIRKSARSMKLKR
jgi:hypothetical protein